MMTEDLLKRIRGGLYGVAAGDAMGATLEFVPRGEIQRLYGTAGLREMVGGGWLGLVPGEWTDDTDMTLAVAEGIVECPRDPVDPVGQRFLTWLASGPPDVGATVRLALKSYLATGDWLEASRDVERMLGDKAAGNGALMRTLPVGLAYAEDADTVRMALQIANMTHPHPAVAYGCALYSLLASRLLTGADRGDALQGAREAVAADGAVPTHVLTLEMLERLPSKRYEDLKPTGYTLDTLEAALWCFLHAPDPEEAVVLAANLGGDADTVAAVAGGLAGTYWGVEAIPLRWRRRLFGTARLDEVATDLAAVRERTVAGCMSAR